MGSSASPVKGYVFDLDGTLFDTRALVREAYLKAGVVMPDDAWGKPAVEWLPDVTDREHWKWIHEKKTIYYDRLIRESPPARTTACRAMIDLALSGCPTYIITGASREATTALLSGLQSYHYRVLGCGCNLEVKVFTVQKVGARGMVYVDDDAKACEAMREIGCETICYDLSMTKEEVLEPWVRSSSRRDVVND
jgi:FMN phosphatase YigB (HAD superfamily)